MSVRFKNLKITNVGVIAIVAGLYFLAAKLGLSLAFLNASVSPVWPPTGVAIALVFLLGYRSAPGVLLGALIANYFLTDVSLATAVGIELARETNRPLARLASARSRIVAVLVIAVVGTHLHQFFSTIRINPSLGACDHTIAAVGSISFWSKGCFDSNGCALSNCDLGHDQWLRRVCSLEQE